MAQMAAVSGSNSPPFAESCLIVPDTQADFVKGSCCRMCPSYAHVASVLISYTHNRQILIS